MSNSSRQVVLDTETTGLSAAEDRIIEIGCIELIDRVRTGRVYHQYINPKQKIGYGAYKVHGISNDFLEDKPLFEDVMDDFMAFIVGSELIIHNAKFDVGFIEAELRRADHKTQSLRGNNYCKVLDTWVLAKEKHPGMKNNLNALCKRYDISSAHRELHGALLDSELLAAVYLKMTSIQNNLFAESLSENKIKADESGPSSDDYNQLKDLPRIEIDEATIAAHKDYLSFIKEQSGNCILLDTEE
jgi:DNA polymerase III subunit epsilon